MLYLILGAILILVDQITKIITVSNFNQYESVTVISGILDFTRHHNTGGPWSLLDEYSFIFIIVTILIFIAEIFYFKKYPLASPWSKFSCTLINAGAIGNLIDRIFRGYVVDMIEVTFINYPVFNFADCCIVVGCILMCIYVIFIYKEPEKQTTADTKESDNGENNA